MVNKNIFGLFFVLVFVVITIFNVGIDLQGDKLTDVNFANIEALANGEGTNPGCCDESGTVCILNGEKSYDKQPCMI